MDKRIFRLAKETDGEEILSIYRPYVENTVITFEYEVPSLEEFTKRIRDISRDYPYIVCEEEGKILGYAYAHKQMERAAYQWNAELSVYVENTRIHQGIGTQLYRILMELLKLQNVVNVYGIVTSPNENSEMLHQAMGFKRAGLLKNTGYKFGVWRDVSWFEKRIQEENREPKPFLPIRKVKEGEIEEQFQRL